MEVGFQHAVLPTLRFSLFAKQLKAGVSCGASWVCIFVLNGANSSATARGAKTLILWHLGDGAEWCKMVRNSPKLITNQLLYQLSYIGLSLYSSGSAAIRQIILPGSQPTASAQTYLRN
jgi:hypothetical protein